MTIAAIDSEQITIRAAYPDDESTLRELAQLDSAAVPAQPVLVAESGGRVRAALSLADGGVVADPFHPTERLTILLRLHAAQLDGSRWGAVRRRRSAVRAAVAVWRALAPRERAPSGVPAPQSGPASARDAALASSPQAFLRAS